MLSQKNFMKFFFEILEILDLNFFLPCYAHTFIFFSQWNCKLMDECYSFVSKPITDVPSTPKRRTVERGRSYSTFLGSYNQDDANTSLSSWTLPKNTEALKELDNEIDD